MQMILYHESPSYHFDIVGRKTLIVASCANEYLLLSLNRINICNIYFICFCMFFFFYLARRTRLHICKSMLIFMNVFRYIAYHIEIALSLSKHLIHLDLDFHDKISTSRYRNHPPHTTAASPSSHHINLR